MSQVIYGAGYIVEPGEGLSSSQFSVAETPPPDSDETFVCEVLDASGEPLSTIDAHDSKVVSAPIPLADLTGDHLTLKLSVASGSAPPFGAKISLGPTGVSKLAGMNIAISWREYPGARPELMFTGVPATDHMYTSFEDHGMFYFLSYIPWIKHHYVQASPPAQSAERAHTGTYSCGLYEGVFGTSYLDTIDLDVPTDAYKISVDFWASFAQPPPQHAFHVVVYLDGKKASDVQLSRSQSDTVWANYQHSIDVPRGTKKASVMVELSPGGHLGLVAYLDDLSVNFVTETNQIVSYGASLDGGYVSAPDIGAYHFGTGDFTCEAWVKPTYQGPVFGKKPTEGGSSQYAGFLFQVNPMGVITLVTDDGFGYYLKNSLPTNVFDGKWHHIAAVRRRGAIHIYFDGAEIPGAVASSRSTPLDVTNGYRLLIGSVDQSQQIYRHYKGMLAEVRLWNRARTAEEIEETMYQCLSGTNPGLVGYWDFLNLNADDRSPKHNNGRVEGKVTFDGPQKFLAEVTVGKYRAGGTPGVDWIGDHTFAAVRKPNYKDPYPENVDVFFDAGGGHEPTQPHDARFIDVVVARGEVDAFILMCTGHPVGPNHPKKKEYGHNLVDRELCGLNLTGFRQRTGTCHQVVNRLLYAATWPNRFLTVSDYRNGLYPRGYWYSWVLFGVYGDLLVNRLSQGTLFRKWCADHGFPTPPGEEEMAERHLASLSVASRGHVMDEIRRIRDTFPPDRADESPHEALRFVSNRLERAMGREHFVEVLGKDPEGS